MVCGVEENRMKHLKETVVFNYMDVCGFNTVSKNFRKKKV
jgi:hypothetical protein